MKKTIFIICILLILMSAYALKGKPIEEIDKKISLKYTSVNTKKAIEVDEIIEFYEEIINSIISMNFEPINYSERLHHYIESLEESEIYRFMYLDTYVNSQYQEFYKEFIFINSNMKRAVNSGLFTEDDIYNLSIYPQGNIKPYFTENIHPSNTLPTLFKIRYELWETMIEENSELLLLNESFTFNSWAIVKFIDIEKINIENRAATPVIHSKCIIISSPNSKMIGTILDISIIMFGEDREFFTEQNYLVNYGYSISPRPEKRLTEPRINIDPQMKYISQNNRIYSLTENDDIVIYDSKSMYNSNYHPLEGTDILEANSLFEKITELQNYLKTRGER